MLINSASTQIMQLLYYLWNLTKRFWDRGFSLDLKKTKQLIQEDYEQIYIGPEIDIQMRYAETLSIIFVVLLYSSGMPLLNILLPFNFAFTFIVDKYLCI